MLEEPRVGNLGGGLRGWQDQETTPGEISLL